MNKNSELWASLRWEFRQALYVEDDNQSIRETLQHLWAEHQFASGNEQQQRVE